MARILLTDDDPQVRTMMASLLAMRGHHVEEAQAAREAIEMHRQAPFDLIVTDLVMKEMDGTELLRRVRALTPQTPIIAISGARQGRIYLNMAKLIGAERILAKPFSGEEFLEAVDHVLEQAASRRPGDDRRDPAG